MTVDVQPPGELISEVDLRAAWERILDRDQADDALSIGVRQFARDAEANIAAIHASLNERSWRPGRLACVPIPKADGGLRELHVPPVRDRLVERALLPRVGSVIDPMLGSRCMAFRPGLGVVDAVAAVLELRGDGLRWIVRADIDDCFPSVDRAILREKLLAIFDDQPQLMSMLDLLLDRQVAHPGRAPAVPARGLPQGSPLSPIFVNLTLTDVDVHLAERGYPAIRYADDIVIGTRSREDAEDAVRVLRASLWRLKMRLGDEDLSVMSFEDGFSFLGEDFGSRYPADNPLFRVIPRDRRSLYVNRPGCRVSVREGQVRVDHEDDELLTVPTGHVERLVLFGPAGLTAGARSWAATTGVDVILCSQRGGYLGQLVGASPRRINRRLTQYDFVRSSPRRMEIARGVVAAKIAKQRVLLHRFCRVAGAEAITDALARFDQLLDLLPQSETTAEAMGIEGAAAAAYFDTWPVLLPEGIAFGGRSRRPPRDAVNAALSLGYTILHGEAVAAVTAAGLDAEIGILHEPRDRQFALANDLVEEFRPLIVDQVVLQLFRRGTLTDAHGRREAEGVLLTAAGRELLVEAYEKRMLRSSSGAIPGFTSSYRRLLHVQAQRMAAVVEDRADHWCGLSWR